MCGRCRTASCTTTRTPTRLERDGARFAAGATPRCSRTCTSVRRRFPERLRGMFGTRHLGRRRGEPSSRATGSGSSRSTTLAATTYSVFASELKSLLASGLDRARARLRGDRRVPDLRLRARAADTACRRLEAHARRSMLVVENGEVRVRAILELSPSRGGGPTDGGGVPERLLVEKLEESVRLRLMSDVPLGSDAEREASTRA